MDLPEIIIIAAKPTNSPAMGLNGKLLWEPNSLPEDMKHFVKETSGHAVIMGRITWESISEKHRPLKDRINVVITSKDIDHTDVISVRNYNDAIDSVRKLVKKIFIIGGSRVYKEALRSNLCETAIITNIDKEFYDYDAVFPTFGYGWKLIESSQEYFSEKLQANYSIRKYHRQGVYEEVTQYFNLVKRVLSESNHRDNRTNEQTLSVFGARMEFNLLGGIVPLLTSKKMFWRGIVEELLWFISGSTDTRVLSDKGIHIWDGNSSPEFLSKLGLPDVGPIYGFQWRHFGAEYNGCASNYDEMGVDQLKECIRLIKEDPFSRRIILSSWNPSQLSQMALPPCHMMCQFYVSNNKKRLSCQMYQRSADIGLGVPFNIASYALLTHLIAHVCNLEADKLIHVIGDAHIYSSHIDALRKQIDGGVTYKFPRVRIDPKKNNIDDITNDDIALIDYKFTELILDEPMRMAI